MKKTELTTKMTRKIGKMGLFCKKHAPEAMIFVGVAGIITSTILACRATTKASKIKEDFNNKVKEMHEVAEKKPAEYTKEDLKQDTVLIYTQTVMKYIKLYAPAAALGFLSLGLMIASNHILRKRNIALAAAYTALDQGFKDYRKKIIDRFGEDLDKELRYNIKTKTIEKKIINENGEEEIISETITSIDPNMPSIYAKVYDDGNIGWTDDSEYNLLFLRKQQDYANEKLRSKGYLFLNEVYDMLGFPRTKYGQIVGWIFDEGCPVGDNYVDFGIYNYDDPKKRDFINGREKSIVLDFNVDGNILDMI